MGKRNVEHGAEAGFQALYSAGHGEQHPNGCFVPRQPSLQSDVERWLAADYDTVVRVLGTHEYLQIELEGLLAPPEASTNMVKTAYLPSLDGEVWRTDRLLGDQRSELFGDPTELPADSCCHEIKRFHESDVTQPPVSDFSPELGEGQPRPYFLQKRHTPQRCVDHSFDQNGADILARRGRGEGQGVHHESRIHPRPQDDRSLGAGYGIDLSRQSRLPHGRKNELLTGAHHVRPRLQTVLDLRQHILQMRLGRVKDHVGLADGQDFLRPMGDANPARTSKARQIGYVALLQGGIDVDGADQLQVGAGENRTDSGEPNRTDPVLHNSQCLGRGLQREPSLALTRNEEQRPQCGPGGNSRVSHIPLQPRKSIFALESRQYLVTAHRFTEIRPVGRFLSGLRVTMVASRSPATEAPPLAGTMVTTNRLRVPTPSWALLLFLTTLILNTVINSLLLVKQPDLGILFGELLAILVPTVLAVVALRADVRTTLRLRLPSAADCLLAVPLAVSLAVLNDQLSNLTSLVFPIPEALRQEIARLLEAETAYQWMVRILGLAVGAAVSEELLFRGFMQTSLEGSPLGRTGAILLTSFLFAAMHFIPQGIASYTLAGVVLGITAMATESILIPILIHGLNNASALVLLNVAGLESLGQPVWIPPQILIPAVLIFAITLTYYVKRASEHESAAPAPAPPSPQGPPPERFVSTPPLAPVLKRKTLGWLAVGCAAIGGALVVFGLFFVSLLYSPEVRRQPIHDIQAVLLDALPPSQTRLASRINQEFDALMDVNESGRISLSQFLRLMWVYGEARSDGIISEEEIEAILSQVRLITRADSEVRHL